MLSTCQLVLVPLSVTHASLWPLCVCVCACVRACVRACVHPRVRVCVRVPGMPPPGPGGCLCHCQWWPQIESLTAAGFTVATFDNRGVGRSTAPPPPYTTSQMADDALELLGHLAWAPADTHLAGISMGGMIALELLGRTAFRSAALLVTTPTGPTHSPWPWGGGWPPWPFFATTFRQFFDPTLSARDRELMNMSLNFSAGWLIKDSGFTHPTCGQALAVAVRLCVRARASCSCSPAHTHPPLACTCACACACAARLHGHAATAAVVPALALPGPANR